MDNLENLTGGEILEVVLNDECYDKLVKIAEEKNCDFLEMDKEEGVLRVKLQKI
ncbi:MAG: sulfurtransferase TusA family protein [Nitrospinota bacterium]